MVEKKTVETLVSGGQATAGPPLGPALGPLGVNVVAIVTKINELTNDYAGMKVPVKITIDPETKEFQVEVGTPTTSALIVSALKIQKGSAKPKEEKVGDLSMAQVVTLTQKKHQQLLGKSLKLAAKEVLGSCVSMGVTVEGKDPREIQTEIDDGKYDALFEGEK